MKALCVLMCLFSLSAAAKTRLEIYPLNAQARLETSEELQVLVPRQALNFAVGASVRGYGILAEVSSFETESGSAYSNILRRHQEALLWLRKDFGGSVNFRAIGGAGLGVFKESVRTEIEDLVAHDESRTDPLVGVSFGGALTIQKTLQFSLEGRLFYGSNLEPNPQPDVVLRSGLTF